MRRIKIPRRRGGHVDSRPPATKTRGGVVSRAAGDAASSPPGARTHAWKRHDHQENQRGIVLPILLQNRRGEGQS